jgi:hypothetical protein
MPPKLRAAGYSALKKGGCAEKNKNNEILVYTKNRPAAPSTFQKKKKDRRRTWRTAAGMKTAVTPLS